MQGRHPMASRSSTQSMHDLPEEHGEHGSMAKKKKDKKDTEQITVRLEFEGRLHDLLRDFRFDRRFDNYKAATLDLIETGLIAWQNSKDADKSPSSGKPKASPSDKNKL